MTIDNQKLTTVGGAASQLVNSTLNKQEATKAPAAKNDIKAVEQAAGSNQAKSVNELTSNPASTLNGKNLMDAQPKAPDAVEAAGQKAAKEAQPNPEVPVVPVEERKKNAEGKWVDKDGKLLNEQGQRVNADGKLINDKDQLINEKGKLINKDGQLVNADGKLINDKNQLVNKDGKLVNKDGQLVNEKGQLVNAQGQLVNKDGKRVNENGQLVNDKNQLINAEGQLVNKDGKRVNEKGELLDAQGKVIQPSLEDKTLKKEDVLNGKPKVEQTTSGVAAGTSAANNTKKDDKADATDAKKVKDEDIVKREKDPVSGKTIETDKEGNKYEKDPTTGERKLIADKEMANEPKIPGVDEQPDKQKTENEPTRGGTGDQKGDQVEAKAEKESHARNLKPGDVKAGDHLKDEKTLTKGEKEVRKSNAKGSRSKGHGALAEGRSGKSDARNYQKTEIKSFRNHHYQEVKKNNEIDGKLEETKERPDQAIGLADSVNGKFSSVRSKMADTAAGGGLEAQLNTANMMQDALSQAQTLGNQMQQAHRQLEQQQDAADRLNRQGKGKVDKGNGQIADGIMQIVDGSSLIMQGFGHLANIFTIPLGISEIAQGSTQIATGIVTIATGKDTAEDGSEDIGQSDEMNVDANKRWGTLQKGEDQVMAGLQELRARLPKSGGGGQGGMGDNPGTSANQMLMQQLAAQQQGSQANQKAAVDQNAYQAMGVNPAEVQRGNFDEEDPNGEVQGDQYQAMVQKSQEAMAATMGGMMGGAGFGGAMGGMNNFAPVNLGGMKVPPIGNQMFSFS